MNAVVARLERDLDAMCAETLVELERRLPEVVERLPRETLAAVRSTHERAIALLRGVQETPGQRAAAVDFGRRAAAAGLSPDEVLAGYRVGAEVANQRARGVLLERQASTAAVLELWRWSARFFDDLAERTVDGARREHAARQRARARDQQAALDAFLDHRALPDPRLWTAPDELRVVIARDGDLDLPEGAGIAGRRDGRLVAILGAHDRWLAASATAIVVGPVAEAAGIRESLEAALAAERLTGAAARGVVRAEEHVVELALLGDGWARRALPADVLAPLARIPGRQRALMEATLRAWLDDPGRPSVIAARLRLHPQSVQYRLRRLREVFGDALDDPRSRFAWSLALRLEALGEVGRPSA